MYKCTNAILINFTFLIPRRYRFTSVPSSDVSRTLKGDGSGRTFFWNRRFLAEGREGKK